MKQTLKPWMLAAIRPLLIAMVISGLSLTCVSCSSVNDDPSGRPDVVKPGEGFFTSDINALIDANYPEVISRGYAELVIPQTMFDPGIMQYADYHKDVMQALNTLGYKTYINGGAVRDAIMGTDIHDLDFSTDATPEEMQQKLTGYEVTISTTSGGAIAKAHHPQWRLDRHGAHQGRLREPEGQALRSRRCRLRHL